MQRHPFFALLLLFAACTPRSAQPPTSERSAAASPPAATPSAPPGSGSPQPGGAVQLAPRPEQAGIHPDDRAVLAARPLPVDPGSREAAQQVVQRYGQLIEERRFAEARLLWGDEGRASGKTGREFAAVYAPMANLHSQVGKPLDMEGAAGSSYIKVPFQLSGRTPAGTLFNQAGTLTLRRVNDVPGATAAQLRWHITQADLKSTP